VAAAASECWRQLPQIPCELPPGCRALPPHFPQCSLGPSAKRALAMAEHVLMKTLRRHMARTKNILKEGHSDDAAASGGSAEKTASLKTHSPAGSKGSKRTRSPQNQEADAGRNVLARRSSTRRRSVALHGEEAAQKAKAEAAENHLKTEVTQKRRCTYRHSQSSIDCQ
jgi:hypothetical protein